MIHFPVAAYFDVSKVTATATRGFTLDASTNPTGDLEVVVLDADSDW